MSGESVAHLSVEKWRERLERGLRLSLLAFVLPAAAFLHVATTIRISLIRAGLELGEVTEIYLPGVQPDVVLKQDPLEGTTASSPHVDLLVSSANRQRFYVMPSVVGLEQQEANQTLAAAGLKIAKLNHIGQAGSPKGTIVG